MLIVKELLKNGANINAKTSDDNESVLHVAIPEDEICSQDNLNTIQLLLRENSIDLKARGDNDMTPLEKALKWKNITVAKMIAFQMLL